MVDGFGHNHDEQDPNGCRDDRYARERIAGARAERARAADAAEGTRQTAPLAALNQHQQNQEYAY